MENSERLSRFLSSSNKNAGSNISRLLASTNLVSGVGTGTSSSGSSFTPGAQRDLKSLSAFAKPSVIGLKFGNPSSSGSSSTGSSSSGFGFGSLVSQASGGGLSGLFSGLGGIGPIISGIASLFGGGGKKTLPPLTRFQLPQSQEQTVYVSSQGSTVYEGSSVHPATPAQSVSPDVDARWFLDNSAHIAQAVKTAMLNSSSLNDVVSEVS